MFTAYTTKWYQINGSGTPPVAPPAGHYGGDSITVTALAAGLGSISFTASGANVAGTKTELLLQSIKGKNRKEGAKGNVSKGFVAFATGSLTSSVSAPTGYYAAGYRFVEVATGRETAIVPLTILTVALSVEDGGAVEAASPARKKAA